jgi:hypothetical protein
MNEIVSLMPKKSPARSSWERLKKTPMACYFEPDQVADLRLLALHYRRPVAQVVRDAVDLLIQQHRHLLKGSRR